MRASVLVKLHNAVKGVYPGFEVRLREVPYLWRTRDLSVSGKFLYLSFRDGKPTLDEFVEYIYHRIIPFCIPRKVRLEKDRHYAATGDTRYIVELIDQAKNLFIKAHNSGKTTGEPGELILFILLEALLTAPQLACKMYLKTSEEMPVHGSDSIHVLKGSSENTLCLIWGESKIYQKLSSALDDICASISNFLSEETGRSLRERDIDILKDHMDISEPELREVLIRFFDPYCEESNRREEAFACFVGFDYAIYKNLDSMPKEEQERFFRTAFQARIDSACKLFEKKLRSTGLSHLRIYFFLIPFPSVEELRQKFLMKIGVS